MALRDAKAKRLMIWQTLESKLSTPRMSRYLREHQGDQTLAAEAYLHNMRIAETLVSIFHVLEVSLRNGIQREMSREYRRDDWYEVFDCENPALRSNYHKVCQAKEDLRKRGNNPSHDAVTAELSFGFWTSMFNRKTFQSVSKPLMRVFHYCPKNVKNADTIRGRLNRARDLRNRCFHHEPLLWQPVLEIRQEIMELLHWIDPQLCNWIELHDRVPSALADWNRWRIAKQGNIS